MLYISIRYDDGREQDLYWSLDEDFDRTRPEEEVTVLSVFADGDELDYLVRSIHNLRWIAPSTTWRGESARFVYDNL